MQPDRDAGRADSPDKSTTLSSFVRIVRTFDTAFGMLQPRIGLAWVHDFYADDNAVTVTFADMRRGEDRTSAKLGFRLSF